MPEHGDVPEPKFWEPVVKPRPTYRRYTPYPHVPCPIIQPQASSSTSAEPLVKTGMVAPPLSARPP
eukprot:4441170-Lingulodinium_polyedra.AAC.1